MKITKIAYRKTIKRSNLFAFVFASRVSFAMAVILLLSLLLQPIEQVYASTENMEPVIEVTSLPAESTDETEADTSTAKQDIQNESEEPVTDEELQEFDTSENISESEPDEEHINETIPDDSVEDDTGTTSESSAETASTTPDTATSSTGTTSASDDELPTDGEEVANESNDETANDENEEQEVSDIDTTATEGEQITAVMYSDSLVQFEKEDCVLVSDGSFYCQRDTDKNEVRQDGVYAFPDKDGDIEIFVQKGGELSQITFNTDDDGAPYFDSESNTMVWHRLLNDRYQIISYDVETGEEEQLTNEPVNDMEPARSGRYTVWQHWDNNWEIVLYDGSTMRQLTHSVEHDISPSIRNGLVVWYRLVDGGQKNIQLYNIKTGELTSISDTEGGTISNPRMVVVYESTYDNGDVVTKGYDLITGEIISLDTSPVELPDTIPQPDSTGETRALLQAKVSTKEDNDGDIPTPVADPPEPPWAGEFDLVIGSSTATSTTLGDAPAASTTPTVAIDDMILDLRPLATTTEEQSLEITIEDVVIPPLTIDSGSSTTDTQQ